ncbi:hypothetical protein AX774_g2571, partial [Zancudomyces culisetae]
MSQEENLNRKIQELSDQVATLLRVREEVNQTEDPHITSRQVVQELSVYNELELVLPSITDDFFRTPLEEEERKEIIYGYTKTKGMNYIPPPINETAGIAVKRSDTYLYQIQGSLAQITRPIDNYVHNVLQAGMATQEMEEAITVWEEEESRFFQGASSKVPTTQGTKADTLHRRKAIWRPSRTPGKISRQPNRQATEQPDTTSQEQQEQQGQPDPQGSRQESNSHGFTAQQTESWRAADPIPSSLAVNENRPLVLASNQQGIRDPTDRSGAGTEESLSESGSSGAPSPERSDNRTTFLRDGDNFEG